MNNIMCLFCLGCTVWAAGKKKGKKVMGRFRKRRCSEKWGQLANVSIDGALPNWRLAVGEASGAGCACPAPRHLGINLGIND